MNRMNLLSGKRKLACTLFSAFLLTSLQPVHAQLSLSLALAPELRNAQIIRVSDFNITGSGSVSRLFDLIVNNQSTVSTNAILRFEMASGRFSGTPIVVAVSRPFPVAPGANSFTYQNIARGGDVDYNANVVKELTDAILQTGRLPNDVYTFTLSVSDARQPNVVLDKISETLTIITPTTVDLFFPGAPVGNGECAAQFGLLPQFKWDSNANRFLLTVCEVLPNNTSPEEVMQNVPRLQRVVQRGIDFMGTPSLIYPSGSLPLEYGKKYYWQIHALIQTPSGETRLPSEIWCFKISAPGNLSGAAAVQQLLALLGSSELEALFRDGGPLQGYLPTGAITINGKRIELAELLALLRSQPFKMLSVQVE